MDQVVDVRKQIAFSIDKEDEKAAGKTDIPLELSRETE